MKTLVILDRDYLPTLLTLISKVENSLDILSFSFAIGSSSGRINFDGSPYQIAQAIKRRKEELGAKLQIRFFTEGVRDTYARNRITAAYLKEAGAKIKFGATHAKGFAFDQRYVLFGSTNLTEQSISKNNEANLLIDDVRLAAQFARYFNHLWRGGKHGKMRLDEPLLADGDFKNVLLGLIDGAKRKIEFSIYFFHHAEIEEALIRAHKRGVAIKGFVHQHASFALDFVFANRATVKRLRAAGIKKLFLSIPTTFSHSKYLVVDASEVLMGTGNWLVQDVTTHPQLYIHIKDKKVALALTNHLRTQILEQATSD